MRISFNDKWHLKENPRKIKIEEEVSEEKNLHNL